jgi:hypothetical protein
MQTIINVVSFAALVFGIWEAIQVLRQEHDPIYGFGMALGALALVVIIQDVGGIQDTLSTTLSNVIKGIATEAETQG